MKRFGMVLAAVAAFMALTGCEPKMTITAKSDTGTAFCSVPFNITGTVTPASASSKVVLQKTYGGKWKDANISQFPDEAPVYVSGAVNKSTGHYSLTWVARFYVPDAMHFRVRSSGGSAVSPSFYVPIEFC